MPGPRDESLVVKKKPVFEYDTVVRPSGDLHRPHGGDNRDVGKSVEPLANSLIKDILPQMPTDAAEVCARLTSGDRTAGNQTDRLS